MLLAAATAGHVGVTCINYSVLFCFAKNSAFDVQNVMLKSSAIQTFYFSSMEVLCVKTALTTAMCVTKLSEMKPSWPVKHELKKWMEGAGLRNIFIDTLVDLIYRRGGLSCRLLSLRSVRWQNRRLGVHSDKQGLLHLLSISTITKQVSLIQCLHFHAGYFLYSLSWNTQTTQA